MRRKLTVFMMLALSVMMVFSMAGCGSGGTDISASASAPQSQIADLSGQSLFVYSGAGMKDPMTDIVAAFEEETGCQVDITFGNAAQIVSQITTSGEGDVFIAGAEQELKPLEEKEMVPESKQLVKHVPVIAVPAGNPAGIRSIEDLGSGAKLVFGDAEATPIGKIADAVLKDAGLTEKANILARTTTAPEMITALNAGEADAAIVWKENAEGKDGIEVLDIAGMENYIKVIPAASLSCSANADALAAFLEYLDTDAAHDIWTGYGYEIVA